MKIGFIGAGKVGVSLGKYFVEGGLQVSGYYSRSRSSSETASDFVGVPSMGMEELVECSDIIFITVNDDHLINVREEVSKLGVAGKILVHASGSVSSEVIQVSGVYSYSMHPMYPFSDKFTAYKNLGSAVFSIEGHEAKIEDVKAILEGLGNKVFKLSKDKKALYHLSNVMVSNLVLALLHKGIGYLKLCGVDEETAKEALLPLINSNIDNISNKSFEDSLTGPVERGDISTVEKHLKVIPDLDASLYNNLSKELLEIAKRKNLEKQYDELGEYLRRQQ